MKKKMTPKLKHAIAWGMIIVGAVVAVMGAMNHQYYDVNLPLILGFVLVVIGFVYGFVAVRCPNCGEHLIACNGGFPLRCPGCNEKLD